MKTFRLFISYPTEPTPILIPGADGFHTTEDGTLEFYRTEGDVDTWIFRVHSTLIYQDPVEIS